MFESITAGYAALAPQTKRLAVIAAVGLALLVLVAWAVRPRPVAVDMAAVTRGPMTLTVTEEARTRVREVYTLSAPISGRLARVDVEPGDPVIGGETVVARLYPADPDFRDARSMAELTSNRDAAVAARDAAAAHVRRAQAELTEAQAAFDRDRQLLERNAIAQARMDRSRAARDAMRAGFDAAQDGLRAAQAQLASAEAALLEPATENGDAADGDACCVTLRAPVDGLIMRVREESETVLQSGMAIVDVGDPNDLEVYSEILSSDAVTIRAGAPVRIDGWGGPDLAGRVRRVEPAAFTKVSALGIEEQRVNVLIDIESPRDAYAGLGHDFRVDVHVEVWRGEDVVQAPDAALFRLGEAWGAFVVEGGRARHRVVQVGRSDGRVTEITDGLAPGERLVLYPPDALDGGARVRARTAL